MGAVIQLGLVLIILALPITLFSRVFPKFTGYVMLIALLGGIFLPIPYVIIFGA